MLNLVTKHLVQMPQGSLAHPQILVITTEMSHTVVIKGDYLQSWEISSKTTFVEFGLAKSDSRQSSECEVQRRFPKYILFHPPVLRKDG